LTLVVGPAQAAGRQDYGAAESQESGHRHIAGLFGSPGSSVPQSFLHQKYRRERIAAAIPPDPRQANLRILVVGSASCACGIHFQLLDP
jgi:hypothetical protein